jgi:hypothetical protein
MRRYHNVSETVNTIKCDCGIEFRLSAFCEHIQDDGSIETVWYEQDNCQYCPYCGVKFKVINET